MVDWEAFYSEFRSPGFISGYEIQNHLGGGAFGEVYKARKISIGKPYAIKFLKLDGDAEAAERELDSVRLFASIDHPNLVTIEDMGVAKGVPYLIMGYAGEETLGRRMKRGDLDEESALRYFVQACRGVLALHDRRLAHFDLKPGNIFLKGEVARVGDYGLAKLLTEGRQTLSFGRGTPQYMAPEMLRNRADHRADVYSLGVILFESLTGELPYEGTGEAGIVVRESDDPPCFPPGFPVDLRGVVERCLRLDPDLRYASVHDLLQDLGQTARQGDSVRIRLGDRSGANKPREPGGGLAPVPDADGKSEETPSTTSTDLKLAAAELARGAVGVARGVWDGVVDRVSNASASEDRGDGKDADSKRPVYGDETPDEGLLGMDVVSVHGLDETPSGPLSPTDAEPRSATSGGKAGKRESSFSKNPLREGFVLSAPYAFDSSGRTVPVPPRAEGGVLGTLGASLVLGAEILGSLLTGPFLYAIRGTKGFIDHAVKGVPGFLGGSLRFVLFLMVLALLGGLVAFLILAGVALTT